MLMLCVKKIKESQKGDCKMAKTLEERGFPIIDAHGHHGSLKLLSDGSPGKFPPLDHSRLPWRNILDIRNLLKRNCYPPGKPKMRWWPCSGNMACIPFPMAWTASVGQGEEGHDND